MGFTQNGEPQRKSGGCCSQMNTGRWIPRAPVMWDRVLACRVPVAEGAPAAQETPKEVEAGKLQLQGLPLHQGLPLLVLVGSSNSKNETARSEGGFWGAAAAEPPQCWGTELRAVLPPPASCWQELAGFFSNFPRGASSHPENAPFHPRPEESRCPQQLLPPSSPLCWGLLCSAARAGSAWVRLS